MNVFTMNPNLKLFFLEDNNCAKLFLKFMHKCTSYGPLQE